MIFFSIFIFFMYKKIENLITVPFFLVSCEAACSSGGVSCLAWTVGGRGDAASGGASCQPGMLPKSTGLTGMHMYA